MEQIYRNTFEGKTLLGKFFHKNAVSSLACQAVRNRAVFLKEYIQKTKGGRILSVAAGLIKEVRHFLSGLYDYIKTFPRNPRRGAVALTKQLFDLVKPGGKLIIGNFSDNNPKDIRFGMEYLYDWNLIHRDRKQIIQFADTIAADQIDDMVVKQEPLGINYFLIIAKKANPVF